MRLTHVYHTLIRWSQINQMPKLKGHAPPLTTQAVVYKMTTTSLSNCVCDTVKKLHFLENIRFLNLNSAKRSTYICLSVYQKHDFMDYSQLVLCYLKQYYLCYFMENLIFSALRFSRNTRFLNTVARTRREEVSFVAKVLRKGLSILCFFHFFF